MKLKIFAVVAFVFSIYSGLVLYIGTHGIRYLNALHITGNKYIYWSVFLFISFSFFITRLLGSKIPHSLIKPLDYISGYWMGSFTYLLVFILLFDLLGILNSYFNLIPIETTGKWGVIIGTILLGIILLKVLYGTINARKIHVEKYEISVDKQVLDNNLSVVMLSDLHLGSINNNKFLLEIIKRINSLSPDLVLFVGDIIDDKIDQFKKQNMQDSFKMIQAKWGSFAVAGNHDYYGGHVHELKDELDAVGVQFLMDETVIVNSSLYIVGRNDIGMDRFSGVKRKALSELLNGVDHSKLILLMDHQPSKLDEAVFAGVDVQFSGHTHRGQMYPFHHITKRIFELDWGYLKKGTTHFIVSSGIGTWGPPIRTASKSEIVHLIIKNKEES